LNDYYSGFVSYVSKKRSLPTSEAEDAAKGRVWLGGQAKTKKLIDELGGYLDALKATAKNVDLAEGEFEPWVLEESRGLFGIGGTGSMMQASGLTGVLPHSMLKSLKWGEALKRSPFLYWSPNETYSD
jgi:ClpP class serine protease